jgi:hypothetical protein
MTSSRRARGGASPLPPIAMSRRTLLIALLVAPLACDGPVATAPEATPTPAPAPTPAPVAHEVGVRGIDVTPGALALHPSWRESLTVVLTDSAGNRLTGRGVAYASDDPLVATVREGGVVTGAAPGTTAIRVTSGSVTVRVPVTVTPAPAVFIAIAQRDTTITEGQTRFLTVAVRDARGIPLGDRPVTWITSDAAVLHLSPIGGMAPAANAVATGVGEATVTASASGLTTSVRIGVRPRVASVVATPDSATLHVGETVQVGVTLRDAAGNVLTDRPVTFMTTSAVAPVGSTGLVRALFDGTARIVVRSEGVADTVQVTVLRPVYFVDVSPRIVTMSVGTTLPLTVTLRDVAGRELTGRTVSFATANPAVARVSDAGIVTAVGRGVTMLTVTSEGRSTQAQVTVP